MTTAECAYCGVPIGRRRGNFSRDHIRPKAWGGSDDPSNIRFSCVKCNHLRARCGHCLGVMACVETIARETRQDTAMIIYRWRLRQPIPPDYDMASFALSDIEAEMPLRLEMTNE